MPATLLSPMDARNLILAGQAPAGLHVNGHLDFVNTADLTALPDGLTVKRLTLNGCASLRALPAGLCCYELEIQNTPIMSLPPDIQVEYRLALSECAALRSLPAGLKTGSLILRDCPALQALPEGLKVFFLDIAGCAGLTQWPKQASVRVGRLNARGCAQLSTLPPWLANLAQLDVSGCVSLAELPEGLRVSSWLDLANTQIRALPPALQGVQLRWRGVPITERIALHPETITAQQVLSESNAELRRVLLERMGYEAFFADAQAEVLDRDQDPGGERRLLRVPLQSDEPLVCVVVRCPSTGRQYIIRVPPTTWSCHQAAAWIAGFDNPDEYHPIAEA